jgi:hypothetical protein
LLRAGVAALRMMPNPAFLAALAAVPILKPGRPKNGTPGIEPPAESKGKKRRKTS